MYITLGINHNEYQSSLIKRRHKISIFMTFCAVNVWHISSYSSQTYFRSTDVNTCIDYILGLDTSSDRHWQSRLNKSSKRFAQSECKALGFKLQALSETNWKKTWPTRSWGEQHIFCVYVFVLRRFTLPRIVLRCIWILNVEWRKVKGLKFIELLRITQALYSNVSE